MLSDLAFATYWSLLSSMGFNEYWDWRCAQAKKELHEKIDSGYYMRWDAQTIIDWYRRSGTMIYYRKKDDDRPEPYRKIEEKDGHIIWETGAGMAQRVKNKFINLPPQP